MSIVDEEEPTTTEEGTTEEQGEFVEEEQQIMESEQLQEEAVEPSSESDIAASSELDEEEPATDNSEDSEDYAAPAAENNLENVKLLSGECGAEGDNLTWELIGEDKLTLYINGSGEMVNYTEDSRAPWAESAGNIATINIGSDVTSIGSYAFSGCQGVEELSISLSIAFIGKNAFLECSSLNTIYYDGTQEAWERVNHSVLPEGTNVICARVVKKIQAVKEKTQAAVKAKQIEHQAAKEYSIIYRLMGGKNSKSNPTTYTKESPTIKLAKPKKKGYIFNGWYSDKGYKNTITAIEKGSTGNKTVYAKWTKREYTIKYVLNKGKGPKENPNSYNVTSKTIKLKKPTRKYYVFKGWYNEAKFKTKVTSIPKGSTGNLKLYAKWAPKKYTITYKMNGGTNNKKNPATYTKFSKKIKLAAPTKRGYGFDGWYTDKKFKKKITTIKKGSSGNKTVYARWKKRIYMINYVLNGGRDYTNNPPSYTINDSTITLEAPKKDGYVFVGWYKEPTFKTKVTKIPKGSAGDLKLYAKWVVEKSREEKCIDALCAHINKSGTSIDGAKAVQWQTVSDSGIIYTNAITVTDDGTLEFTFIQEDGPDTASYNSINGIHITWIHYYLDSKKWSPVYYEHIDRVVSNKL